MTVSSDVPEYAGFDLVPSATEEEILDAAIQRVENALPEWTPRPGNTEVVLLEAMSMLLGLELVAINDVPDVVFERLLALHKITRSPGQYATATATFTVGSTEPVYTIPTGVTLRLLNPDTGEDMEFETTEAREIVVAEGRSATIAIRATEYGAQVNGVAAGAPLEVVDALPFVDSVRLGSIVLGGEDEEDDDSLFNRGAARMARMTSTIVLADQFSLAAIEDERVARAFAQSLADPDRPGVEAPGHVTVTVLGYAGELDAGDRESIRQALAAQAVAGLKIHVVPPDVTDLSVEVDVIVNSGAVTADVLAAVEHRVTRYLTPLEWDWSEKVYRNVLVAHAAAVPGVARVVDVRLYGPDGQPVEDVTLVNSGVGGVPNLLSVTATEV